MKDKFELRLDIENMVSNAKQLHNAGKVARQAALPEQETRTNIAGLGVPSAAPVSGQPQGPNPTGG